MSLRRVIRLVAFIGGLTFAGSAAGLATDREQPIEVEADYVEVDDRIGVAVYRGDVVVTQGTMRFTGKTLTMSYTEGQSLKEALLEGAPATFRQRLENEDQDIEGEAIHMRYEAASELVHLIDNVKVVRRGQIYTGHHMTYDATRNLLTARKAQPGELSPSGSEAAAPDERVKIIIPPEKEAEPKRRREDVKKSPRAKRNRAASSARDPERSAFLQDL